MKGIATYTGMLLSSFFVVSLVWYNTVRGRLYVCTDPIPVCEYFGSHVHTSKEMYYMPLDPQYGTTKDHYLASKWLVDTLWWFSFGSAFLLAGVATHLLRGRNS